MVTTMEYDVLREIVSDIDGIFSRVVENDDEKAKEDSKIVDMICRDILNNIRASIHWLWKCKKWTYQNKRWEYKNRPYSKRTIQLQKEADEEFEKLQEIENNK